MFFLYFLKCLRYHIHTGSIILHICNSGREVCANEKEICLSLIHIYVEMMGLIGMGNNPMVGASVAVAVAVSEAMNK